MTLSSAAACLCVLSVRFYDTKNAISNVDCFDIVSTKYEASERSFSKVTYSGFYYELRFFPRATAYNNMQN